MTTFCPTASKSPYNSCSTASAEKLLPIARILTVSGSTGTSGLESPLPEGVAAASSALEQFTKINANAMDIEFR